MDSISTLLSSSLVRTLLNTHPNDLTSASPHVQWQDWWQWAAYPSESSLSPWVQLVNYYTDSTPSNIPQQLTSLIDTLRSLELPRTPDFIPGYPGDVHINTPGMSPKKLHEVSRMAAYISHLLSLPGLKHVRHVVDVGAGQGYLSRALRDLGLNVLALDNDELQTNGAQLWDKRIDKRSNKKQDKGYAHPEPTISAGVTTERGSITHKTIHITPTTLHSVIDEWISELPSTSDYSDASGSAPTPILIVALHACGSLTPNILRAFVTAQSIPSAHQDLSQESSSQFVATNFTRNSTGTRTWTPLSLVAVGCCYNLMDPSDFPLSPHTADPRFPRAAFQLAAQIPAHWLPSQSGNHPGAALPPAALAIRKVVYRAMLQNLIRHSAVDLTPDKEDEQSVTGVGTSPILRRLGRLNDSAYDSWETFVSSAEKKVCVTLDPRAGYPVHHLGSLTRTSDAVFRSAPADDMGDKGGRDEEKWSVSVEQSGDNGRTAMENRLAVLHTLRCFLGPCIESLILLDRLKWMREELACGDADKIRETEARRLQQVSGQEKELSDITLRGDVKFDVDLVNLFDQAKGSGRNVAVVVRKAS